MARLRARAAAPILTLASALLACQGGHWENDPGSAGSAAEVDVERPDRPVGDGSPAERGPGVPNGPASTAAPATKVRPAPQQQQQGAERLAYLEESARQARRLEELIGDLGPNRLGSAALAAAALAANGRTAWREPASRWTAAALDRCTGDWDDLDCELALLSLQRVALQFADALPEGLRGRLRTEATRAAPPPGPALVRDPWAFRRTENQQMAVMARSLAAHAVAGSGGSPAARAWADYAEAFLVAHDRDGWYEGDSPGYMATSITALLHLFDHAPDRRVRDLAGRQLQLLFVEWAENQVGGIPAGPRSRTYLHWAQGVRNLPWPAWFHYATGLGAAADLPLGDWPEIATSGYEFPDAVVDLLRSGRSDEPYAVRSRRHIRMQHRLDLDAATYSWVTPDYVLGTAPAVNGLSLAVSGGQEIQVTLYPAGPDFAPLYLWSRAGGPRSRRWRSLAGEEQAVGWQNLAVARMGTAARPGYAWLAPPWSRPEPLAEVEKGGGGEQDDRAEGDVLVARYAGTYVALVTAGGWQVAPAPRRFPDYFGDKASRGSWVAVPRRQPAAVGLEVGRASEVGSWADWKRRAARLRLVEASGEDGDGPPGARGRAGGGSGGRGGVLTLRSGAGHRLVFRPGVAAEVDGARLSAAEWSLHASPFLTHEADGAWRFTRGGSVYRFVPLEPDR